MSAPIRVEVGFTETMYLRVDRDVWNEFYEIPEDLVVAHETALAAFDAASKAINDYIDANNLQPEEIE